MCYVFQDIKYSNNLSQCFKLKQTIMKQTETIMRKFTVKLVALAAFLFATAGYSSSGRK